MSAKHLGCYVAWRSVIMIVEASFPDADAFGMARQIFELLGRYVRFLMRIMRMRADSAKDLRVAFGDPAQRRK